MTSRILVAGIGNIFLGDDAFGVEAAQLLQMRSLRPEVRVVDFGIRGLDLAYALLEDWDAAILVDAVPRGEPPGTLYVIEPTVDADVTPASPMDAHSLDPVRVLQLVQSLGGRVKRLLVVGCEPSPLDHSDMQSGLSPPVARALPEAADLVESLVARLVAGPCNSAAE